MLSGQLDPPPQRLLQLRPLRLDATKLIQLALQLPDRLGDEWCAFLGSVTSLRRLTEPNRTSYMTLRTLSGNSRRTYSAAGVFAAAQLDCSTYRPRP
jgi:hypothetical protein